MTRTTHALVDLDAIAHNLHTLKTKLQPGTKLMAVVKSDAYGHGMLPIATAALQSGAEYLGVALPEEGILLRQGGITAPILVLGSMLPYMARDIVEYALAQTVYTVEACRALQEAAQQQNSQCTIHIKIDTGMRRIGAQTQEELRALLETLKDCDRLHFEGMYTHLAESDAADQRFTLLQLDTFRAFIDMARDAGYSPLLHCNNSGGILTLPQEMQLDMVRAGIALYGYTPSFPCKYAADLMPVLSWRTSVVHVKTIAAGDSVSYSRLYTAKEPRVIATLPVGYGDGYKRIMSNRAWVLIHGRRAPVVGAICMDQCMADVTGIDEVHVGDEAILLGAQGDEAITANDLAAWSETISYEVLLSLTGRVPRVYTRANHANNLDAAKESDHA